MAAGFGNGDIIVWDVRTKRQVASIPRSPAKSGEPVGIFALVFLAGDRSIAIGRHNGGIEEWNLTTLSRSVFPSAHHDTVNGLSLSPDGKLLASASWDNTVRLWDVSSRRLVHTFVGHVDKVTSATFSPDGRLLASGAGGEVKLWDTVVGS